jgi:prephenate dehydrogenase
MSEPDFSLMDANLAIIGLGLMGGSLALALKARCRRLSAYDPDPSALELARRQEIVHLAENDPVKVLAGVDLVILACPVPAILGWIGRLPDYIRHPCIVLDIGSSKRAIVAAFDSLPANFDPLGGHPICGRERLSLENAERFLYRDAPFALTRLSRTGERTCSAALQIVEALGAHPIWLDADDHDRILASTSHMPYLLSSALALATPEDSAPLIGPGFRSTSRLAGTPPSMMLGVLGSNRDNVLDALDQLQTQIAALKSALISNDLPKLQSLLTSARNHYQRLITEN